MNLSHLHTESGSIYDMQVEMKDFYRLDDIVKQLETLNVPEGKITLMHSSLRSVGSVEDGAAGLLDVLIRFFTKNGGLFCVPTHTWHNLKNDVTLDVKSEDHCLGEMSKIAIRDGRGIRSLNPTHSMVVFGDRYLALDFVKDELNVETPTAPKSCYGKIIESGGSVLLVGVNHQKNTVLHTVDEMLSIPNRMEDEWTPVSVINASGERFDRRIRLFYTDYTDDISYRFYKYETAFRYHGCITDGFIGNAPVQLCNAWEMKRVVELIYKNSNNIDPLYGEDSIPQKWYCMSME